MKASSVYRPRTYFITTFIVTYILWAVGAYATYQEGLDWLYLVTMLPGLMMPFIISVIMIRRSKDPGMKKDFRQRLFDLRRINVKMLPLIFFLMPVVMLISITVSLLVGGSIQQFQLAEGFSFSSGMVPVLLLLLMAATFEELGWRGYAFDSLQSRYSFFKASLIFSVLWSLWHLPLIFVKDSYQYSLIQENIWYVVNFFVSIIPMGIIISWVCYKNRKSVFSAILFHFLINISQELFNVTQMTKCIETGILTIVAVLIMTLESELFFRNQQVVEAYA